MLTPFLYSDSRWLAYSANLTKSSLSICSPFSILSQILTYSFFQVDGREIFTSSSCASSLDANSSSSASLVDSSLPSFLSSTLADSSAISSSDVSISFSIGVSRVPSSAASNAASNASLRSKSAMIFPSI